MVDLYHELLDATINHLRDLKAGGRRFVPVSPDTLKRLGGPDAGKAANRQATRASTTTRAAEPGVVRVSPAPPPRTAPPPPQALVSPVPPVGPSPVINPADSVTAPGLPALVSSDALAADKAALLTALRQTVLACTKCGHLAAARTNVVFGVGNPNAELMFVGEAPGADEDLAGEPFVGKAGQLLTKIIQTMGLGREHVYIANILKCRPDTPGQSAGNRKPTPQEMATCISYLERQIDIIKPKVLVALGATAVEGLLGKTVGITRLRGNWQFYRGIPLMPTYHPAYLLRNQALSEKRKVWEDMLKVMGKLSLPISDKQKNYFL